ncbi:fatty acid desaturase [bacterium]|nr:MAG: fatty acid desaturase [bacterium]
MEPEIIREIEDDRPRIPVGLLSREEKDRLIERGFLGLYRWYVARSQETRNWNPDTTFDWRNMRQDHSPEVIQILEGFFAVEQYVPDYVSTLLDVIRTSHGRSHFHIRWGSEEERHADLWYNAVLFSGHRSGDWLRDYMGQLRGGAWKLPWEDPMHMIFYTVFQERATQVNYLNLANIARGKSEVEGFRGVHDPVLDHASRVIAADEAAHYNFFLEGARLYLYYYPTKALECMVDVIRHFAMPAGNIIPNYDQFAELVHRAAVYGPREHAKDVVAIALKNLGVAGRKALETGIKKGRMIPDENGNLRDSAIFEGIDFPHVRSAVRRIFGKIEKYEREVGFWDVDPTHFIPNYEGDLELAQG